MAQSYHQAITKPRLYVSYPLFLYASGGMDAVRNHLQGADNISDRELYRLITLDPSQSTELPVENSDNWLAWRSLPNSRSYDSVNDNNLVFNSDNSYAMILGHNLNSANGKTWLSSWDEDEEGNMINDTPLESNITTIKNYSGHNSVPEYDGWSAWQLGEMPNNTHKWIGLRLSSDNWEDSVRINSVLYGKFFNFPQNCELQQTLSFSYGNKQKLSLSGKTISTSNWDKTDEWATTEPFGLGNDEGNPFRKSGRRTWEISFSSLLPKYLTNQNMMLNSAGYEAMDNHSTTTIDGQTASLYNAYNGIDFYTNVIKMTKGGHLPMVLCLSQTDTSPSNWAIVRLKSDFKITQKSPNLYNIKITLVEQI